MGAGAAAQSTEVLGQDSSSLLRCKSGGHRGEKVTTEFTLWNEIFE